MTTARRAHQAAAASGGQQLSPVATEVLKEARRYQTVDTVAGWPIVYNTSTNLADHYTSLKVRRCSQEAAGAVG